MTGKFDSSESESNNEEPDESSSGEDEESTQEVSYIFCNHDIVFLITTYNLSPLFHRKQSPIRFPQ